MDSGNSGSISSSGDEEYDSSSRGADHQTLLHPTTFLNHQFGSISSHPQQPSLVSSSSSSSHHHLHPSLFDLCPSYLHHALSQSQPTNSFLNLESSTPNNCTEVPPSLQGLSSPSSSNQFPLGPHHQGLARDPSLQLRSVHDDNNARAVLPSSSQGNNNNNNNNNNNAAARSSKKRTRASRRAPTTVLTTDTSNFRAMVQEFTGIPAPPFSGSSYSRRLDILTGSSSLRSSASHHLDNTTTSSFYPLRPSPQKVHHHQNPLLIPSSSSSSPPLLHSNMVDALASSTTNNVTSSATINNNSSSNNSINYQLPPDLGLPYHHHQQQQNIMLSMQNHHPIIGFHPPPPAPQQPPLHHHLPAGFSAKSSQMPISFENLGMSHGHDVNAHHNLVGSGGHGLVTSEGMPLRNVNSDDDDGCRDGGEGDRRDPLRSFDGGYGNDDDDDNNNNNNNNNKKVASASAAASGGGSYKMNFSASASDLNHEKGLMENNTSTTTTRGGEAGAVDSWICPSD